MTHHDPRSEILYHWTQLSPNEQRDLISQLSATITPNRITNAQPAAISAERRAREERIRRAQEYKTKSYSNYRRF